MRHRCFSGAATLHRLPSCTPMPRPIYAICARPCGRSTSRDGGTSRFVPTVSLRNMVRAVVGTLVDVGRGKMPPEGVSTCWRAWVLAARPELRCLQRPYSSGTCVILFYEKGSSVFPRKRLGAGARFGAIYGASCSCAPAQGRCSTAPVVRCQRRLLCGAGCRRFVARQRERALRWTSTCSITALRAVQPCAMGLVEGIENLL